MAQRLALFPILLFPEMTYSLQQYQIYFEIERVEFVGCTNKHVRTWLCCILLLLLIFLIGFLGKSLYALVSLQPKATVHISKNFKRVQVYIAPHAKTIAAESPLQHLLDHDLQSDVKTQQRLNTDSRKQLLQQLTAFTQRLRLESCALIKYWEIKSATINCKTIMPISEQPQKTAITIIPKPIEPPIAKPINRQQPNHLNKILTSGSKKPKATSSVTTKLIQNNLASLATNNSISASSSSLGIVGPLSFIANYSAHLGTSVTAKWTQGLGQYTAMALDAEYGRQQQRINGTFGVLLGRGNMLKVTGEYLRQKLDFDFDSGTISQWIGQQAYGAMYTYVLPHNSIFLAGITADVSYSMASSKNLATKYFYDTGGHAYANFRRIAGGVDEHAELGVNLLHQVWTSVNLALNYDVVKYATKYNVTDNNTRGFGAVLGLQQLLSRYTKLKANLDYNKAYKDYKIELDQLLPFSGNQLQLSLAGEHLITAGSGNFSRDNRIQLGAAYSFGTHGKTEGYNLGTSIDSHTNLVNWTQTPAVYMPQVLAIADQKTVALPYFNLNDVSYEEGDPVNLNLSTEIHAGSNQTLTNVTMSSVIDSLHLLFDKTTQTIKLLGNAPHTPGTTKISITAANDGGVSQTSSFNFTTLKNPAPKITSLSIYSVLQGKYSGARNLTIKGYNFMPQENANSRSLPQVFFGSTEVPVKNIDSAKTNDTQIVIKDIPQLVSGTVAIKVINREGTASTDKVALDYEPLKLNSNKGYINDIIQISGGGFIKNKSYAEYLDQKGAIIKTEPLEVLNDARGHSDSTKAEIKVPNLAGIPDKTDLELKIVNYNNDSSEADSSSADFDYIEVQHINDLNPAYSMLSGNRVIKIDGNNFDASTETLVNNTKVAQTHFISPNEIDFTSPQHNTEEAVNVQVLDPNANKLNSSNIMQLHYYQPILETPTGTTGTDITIDGHNFENSRVQMQYQGHQVGADIIPTIAGNKLSFMAPAKPTGQGTGTIPVTFVITNYTDAQYKTAEDSGAVTFTYTATPPHIDEINPQYRMPKGGPRFITVDGENFDTNAVVISGITEITPTVISANKLVFPAPTATKTVPYDATIEILNPNTKLTSNSSSLHYYQITPSTNAGEKGETITITGHDFENTKIIPIDDKGTQHTAIAATVLPGNNSVSFIVPANPNSDANPNISFLVTNYDKNSIAEDADSFTFSYAPPVITAISPDSRLPNNDITVTLQGKAGSFKAGDTVLFDNKELTATYSNNTLQFTAPTAANGIHQIRVKTPGGAKSDPVDLDYKPLSLSATSGIADDVITIHGVGFNIGDVKITVPFDGKTKDFSNNISYISPTEIKFNAPSLLDNGVDNSLGAANTATFTVTNKTRKDAATFNFTYKYAYITCPTVEQVNSGKYTVIDSTGTQQTFTTTYPKTSSMKYLKKVIYNRPTAGSPILECLYQGEWTNDMFLVAPDAVSKNIADPQKPFRGDNPDQNDKGGTSNSYYCHGGTEIDPSYCQFQFTPSSKNLRGTK